MGYMGSFGLQCNVKKIEEEKINYYFLAKLCDYQIDDDDDDDRNLDTNTFIRHPRTPFAPEINRLCRQFFSGIWLNPDDYDVKIIITILKEYLFQIEGGVFGLLTKEFFEISLESPLDMTLIYLHSFSK
uniref:Uncharacterized protein n=1 Tax=Romanomermis culicivorax TaxID=13658 RepID=A0A915J434_ROMCU